MRGGDSYLKKYQLRGKCMFRQLVTRIAHLCKKKKIAHLKNVIHEESLEFDNFSQILLIFGEIIV